MPTTALRPTTACSRGGYGRCGDSNAPGRYRPSQLGTHSCRTCATATTSSFMTTHRTTAYASPSMYWPLRCNRAQNRRCDAYLRRRLINATDIPGFSMSSGPGEVVRPGGGFVVDGAGLQAAVQDADEPVGELAQGRLVADVSGSERVVVGAGAGGSFQRAEGPLLNGVTQAGVAGVAGQHEFLSSRGTRDGRGAGVVLARFGVGEAGAVISELGQHPGTEDHAEAGLAGIDLSVPVTAKIAGHHLTQLDDLSIEHGDEPDLAGHDRRERRLYLRGLTQRWRSQHRLDCVGFLLDIAAVGTPQRRRDPRLRHPRGPLRIRRDREQFEGVGSV